MQPQQPYYGPPPAPAQPPQGPQPQPQPQGPNQQYDFILDNQPPKGGGFNATSTSMLQRALIVGGGLVVLIILAVVFINILSGGNNHAATIKVAQEQTEIARVATEAATQQSIDETTKDVALTAQLSITSDQQQLLALLAKEGVKPDTKQLALLKNSQTDSQLSTAEQAGTYGSTFLTVLKADLAGYQTSLKQAFNGSHSKSERQLLSNAYDSATLLLEQVSSTQNS